MASHSQLTPAMSARVETPSQNELRSDGMLMMAWQTGDPEAFGLIYKRHKDGLYAYFVRHTGNSARAGELFQDVWMSVIQGRDKFQDTAPFKHWLYRIAHNRMVDYYRYIGSRTEDDHFNHEVISRIEAPLQPEEIACAAEDRERLDAAVQTLPPAQRDVFVMRMEWQLGVGEIADITGELRETIKSRLRYACNKIRDILRSTS